MLNSAATPDCIELIIRNSKSNPNHTCVIQGDYLITYKQFIDLVATIAAFLKGNNHTKVVINMPQGINSYAAIVAVLLVGGYYCPLNLASPEERKIHIINEFAPDIIITQEDLTLPSSKLDAYNQITCSEILKSNSSNDSYSYLFNHHPNEIAYIIYTSGSTGNPKGVIIKREALNKFLEWSLKAYNCSINDRWAQYSYLSFDLSIVDIFTALGSGCTLVPLTEMGQKMRPANTISKHSITVWHSVPGAVEFMMENEPSRPADLSSIRLMSFCGEPLYEYHLEYLLKKNPGMTIFNTYGPTEGTLFCTWINLNKDNYKKYCDSNVSIGTPIPHWHLLLETFEGDENTKEVTLYGNYLGKGYLNIPSEAFDTKVINGIVENIFKTGDLIKTVNSNLYFVGRKDNQIKLRGHRIELDEIDNWIMKYTGRKSVSVAHSNAIHSFIEVDNIDESGLRGFLEQHIEKYKLPSYFHTIKSFPRNNNQKVDRNVLKTIIDEKRTTDFTI